MEDTPELYIVTVLDPWGREIRLSHTTWHEHIIINHPDVRGQLRKVETTIMRPEHVIEVVERETLIYDSSTFTGLYFNVVVSSRTWLVRTVYRSSDMLMGEIIYPINK